MISAKRIFLACIIVAGLVFVGAACKSSTSNNNQSNDSQVAGETTEESYFSEDAKVMYFYSEYCSWCVKEKEVLQELAKEGYQVKPMDVGKNTNYWQEYEIEGTPTFIGPDNQRTTGYQTEDKLKEFLDKYK